MCALICLRLELTNHNIRIGRTQIKLASQMCVLFLYSVESPSPRTSSWKRISQKVQWFHQVLFSIWMTFAGPFVLFLPKVCILQLGETSFRSNSQCCVFVYLFVCYISVCLLVCLLYQCLLYLFDCVFCVHICMLHLHLYLCTQLCT